MIWRFRICNYFCEISKFRDFMNTLKYFAKSVFAQISAKFKYFGNNLYQRNLQTMCFKMILVTRCNSMIAKRSIQLSVCYIESYCSSKRRIRKFPKANHVYGPTFTRLQRLISLGKKSSVKLTCTDFHFLLIIF